MRAFRVARLRREARTSAHTDWRPVIATNPTRWREAVAQANGPRVLLATNVGLHFGAGRLDSLLAVALTLRGARVSFLFCDKVLPACMAADISWFPDLKRFERDGPTNELCGCCFVPANERIADLGLPVHRLGSWLTSADFKESTQRAESVDMSALATATLDGIPVGEHARSGVLRFFARGTLEPGSEPAARAYLRAAQLAHLSVSRLMTREKQDVVVLHHGIYVPQGPSAAAVRDVGARVVTWNPAYRKQCFIFSHDDTYHRSMLTEPVATWENLNLSKIQNRELTTYLESRWKGTEDWIAFSRTPAFNFDEWATMRTIDPNKPIIALLTNVMWDAQLHYPTNAFSSMREWLSGTVRYFANRSDLQLVIRVHPAEVTGNLPARETAAEILATDIGKLPRNVFVLGPTDKLSTYMLAARSKAAIIYATKAGIELATMGIPVIAAGEAWVRGKGMALEAANPEEYYRILDGLPETNLDMKAVTKRARLYAYHFFFRRMIPIGAMEPVPGWPPYRVNVASLEALAAGADVGLDVVCEGIMNAAPFIYPAK